MRNKHVFLMALGALMVVALSACQPSEPTTPPTNEEIDRAKLKAMDETFASQWTSDERAAAASATGLKYLNEVEKEVFYYLNLMRTNPPLFARTYAAEYNGDTGWVKGYAFDERKESLLKELEALDAMPLLMPDDELYDSADCFATQGGALGNTGHDRTGTTCDADPAMAECCDFGNCATGLAVVMHFLIDAGESNARLGHRRIMLDKRLCRMGVAVRDHAKFPKMAVLDFKGGE